MRRYLKYCYWLLAGVFNPPKPKPKEGQQAAIRYYSTDPENADPRSTASGDDW